MDIPESQEVILARIAAEPELVSYVGVFALYGGSAIDGGEDLEILYNLAGKYDVSPETVIIAASMALIRIDEALIEEKLEDL